MEVPSCQYSLRIFLYRRWLYTCGSPLYSRPYVNVYLRTKEHVYSRPRAGSGGSAALSSGDTFPMEVPAHISKSGI